MGSQRGAGKEKWGGFLRVLLPIFTDAKNDGVLLVQGFEAETPHSPAQVVLLLQGKRLYGFEKLEDLFKAALELFKTGIYTLDQDHDTVNLADEDKARAVWRRFPLIYLENAEMSSLALEDEEEDLDDDDDDDGYARGHDRNARGDSTRGLARRIAGALSGIGRSCTCGR